MDLLADLNARGLVHDATDHEALAKRLVDGPIGVYVGFDPTADSLHVGHLFGQLSLRRFQLAGHRPFPLAGGATGVIGDPSGRSDERNLLDRDTLRANVAAIKVQLERLLDFSPGPYAATLVDNADWTEPLTTLEFLRDVGKHITVNQMLAKESVRARVESTHGISFTEFSYMLLQANDFRWLYEHHDVELQMGGSDQWGNITAGIDLIRRTPRQGRPRPHLAPPDQGRRRQDGQVGRRRGLARPGQDQPVPVPPVPDPDRRRAGRPLPAATSACAPSARSRRCSRPTPRRPSGAWPSGPWPTSSPSWSTARRRPRRRRPPPRCSSAAIPPRRRPRCWPPWPGRCRPPTAPRRALDDVVELLVAHRSGLARRATPGGASPSRRSGPTAASSARDDQLSAGDLLHERYLLLAKGRRTYHLVEIVFPVRLTVGEAMDSVSLRLTEPLTVACAP